MRLGLIGNCSYQALIDERGSVQWMCWPRFDSSFVFGPLVDEEQGGEFSIAPAGDFTSEQAYLPNTNILRTEFHSSDGSFAVTDFAPRFIQFERSFKPLMLIRRIERISGFPRVRVVCRPVYDYGRIVPTSHRASNHIQWSLAGSPLRLTTNVPLSYVQEGRPFVLTDDVDLVLTLGEPLEASLQETSANFLGRTRRYWETWVKHASLPEDYQEEVIRAALVLKLHQFEDTGAITAASTTSLPEHPGSGRNWDYRYCWLRDSFFTLWALRRLGHFEEMEAFVTYLVNIAASSQRLQPVYGISGESELTETILEHLAGYKGSGPVRAGNGAYIQDQHDVYGEMLAAITPLFLDVRFTDPAQHSTQLLHRLLASAETHLETPDAGLWEKRADAALYTFSLLMHWTGAKSASQVGRRHNDQALVQRGTDLALRARALIEGAWREDLSFYAESPSTSDADASLMMMVNLGFLTQDNPKAEAHVRSLARQLRAPGKPHLMYRYLHHDGLGGTEATFTACGFWYAEALARLGFRDEAREVFENLLSHANHLGLLSEDIDPITGEQWGNFPQTYSHVGVINAAFAISPMLRMLD